jgi:hypothetical protein
MKTGKKYYIRKYNFHEILTCLSHRYKNIGQNNNLSLMVYFIFGSRDVNHDTLNHQPGL